MSSSQFARDETRSEASPTESAGDVGLTEQEAVRVRGTLHLLGVRAGDVDDLLQDVQIRLLEYDGVIVSRAAWCCAVAANLARDRARREIRFKALMPRLAVSRAPDDADVALREAVRSGLARLHPDLRSVAVLRFYADLPVGEIASVLQVPEGTVKSRLHRAANELRVLLPRESVTS